jgi:hypothetical protein
MTKLRFLTAAVGIALVIGFTIFAAKTNAIPTFARKYKTSCSTCHYAYPKLNAFGKAFENNGYRYPGGDENFTKEEPVSLGSEGYKRVWPDAIWPADIAGTSPLSVHAFGRLHFGGQWDDPTTPEVEDDKALYFEIPHEFELLFGGTIGDKISYFGELELEHESELAYEFALQYDYSPAVHLKAGSVGLSASPEHHRLTREHYAVEDLRNQSGTWRLRSGAGGGIEVWGAGNGSGGQGGFTYAVGIGNGQNDEDNFDLNTAKDFYARGTYKIGGLGEIGGTEGQESTESAFYIDNSVRLGVFGYSGTALDTDMEDEFSVLGGDVDFWYDRFNVVALFMQMKSDFNSVDRTSLAWFGEGNYVIFPWLIGHLRYEYVDPDTDDDVADPQTNLVPAVIAMIRANVKCSLEYRKPLDEAREDGDRLTVQFNFSI